MKPAPVDILVVDDDVGHARLVERNLRRSCLCNEIRVFNDGHSALAYLLGDERALESPLLILLDLNMPGLTGDQVLSRLKSEPRTRHIPVIILTTTDAEPEMQKCYELGCNFYLTKPVQYDEFVETIRKLGLFLSVVMVPRGHASPP